MTDEDGDDGSAWRAPAIGILVGVAAAIGAVVAAILLDSMLALILAPPLTGGALAGGIAKRGLAIGTLVGFGVGGLFGLGQLALIYSSITSAEPTGGQGIGLAILLVLSMAYVGVATALGGLGGLVGAAIREQD